MSERTPRYATRQEFANKADYEGGLLDFVFGYGVSVDDVPETDTELRAALTDVLAAKPAIGRLEALLPEPGDYPEDLDGDDA